jgi:NAD(P)H-hydrate epimerase
MTVGLPCDAAGRLTAAAIDEVIQLAETATAVALGPGLGRSEELTQLVDQLYRQIACPMVVDADALNALSEQPAALDGAGGPRVLTPHPGEFKRLSNGRYGSAGELAARTGAVVVLKGHQTEVADGRRTFHNTTGNPGMATGGSGDVLTGLITALICQGLSAWEAARLGVHIHGLAGDLAAAELGEVGMIASDLVRFLPAALKGL